MIMKDGCDGLIFKRFQQGSFAFLVDFSQGLDIEQFCNGVYEGAIDEPHKKLGHEETQEERQIKQEADLHISIIAIVPLLFNYLNDVLTSLI